MAQNATNIHVGPGRIWFGVTAPVTGAPPTLMAHTAGVPASGTEVGHTSGNTVITFQNVKADIDSEQAFGVVDTYATGQTLEITMTLQERVYAILQKLFEGLGSATAAGYDLFYGGGPLSSVPSFAVMISSPRRDDNTKYEVFVGYRMQMVSPVPITYSRTERSMIVATLRGTHDTARTVGDQLFQFYREKP
jgi:hypothetical protein